MALKALVEKLEGMDESLKAHYKEQDGKFILDVTPVDGLTLEDTSGLKSALSKERQTARDALDKLTEFGDLSPKEAREAMRKMKDIANWKPEQKVQEQIDAALKQQAAKHQEEMSTLQATNESISGQLQESLITAAATAAITEAGGSAALLLPIVKQRTRMRAGSDGSMVAEVIDGAGNARIADGAGNLMTVDQLIIEMKESKEFARAFDGVNASGGGTPPGSGQQQAGGKTMTRAAFDQMSPQDKVDFSKEGGELTD